MGRPGPPRRLPPWPTWRGPDLFVTRPARIDVELEGTFTRGMTVVDFHSDEPNALVPVRLDVPGFWDYVHDAWGNVHVHD